MEETDKIIDIEKAIKAGNNKFLKSLPRFLVRTIARIIRQDDLNATIQKIGRAHV